MEVNQTEHKNINNRTTMKQKNTKSNNNKYNNANHSYKTTITTKRMTRTTITSTRKNTRTKITKTTMKSDKIIKTGKR